jgi:hypothetical protein
MHGWNVFMIGEIISAVGMHRISKQVDISVCGRAGGELNGLSDNAFSSMGKQTSASELQISLSCQICRIALNIFSHVKDNYYVCQFV